MRWATTPDEYTRGQQPYDEFRAAVERYAEDNDDALVTNRAMAWTPDDELRFEEGPDVAGGLSYTVEHDAVPTMTAASQLLERLDGPPMGWWGDERHTTPRLRSDVLNDVIRHRPESTLLVRTRIQGDGEVIRAVLSDEYSAYNHTDYIDTIGSALEEMGPSAGRVTVHNGRVGDVMSGYLLLLGTSFGPDPRALARNNGHIGRRPGSGGGANLHPAIYFTNSEIGTGKVRLHGGLFSSVCDNGSIIGWQQGDAGVSLTHRHISARSIQSLLADGLAAALRLSEAAAERIYQSANITIQPSALAKLADQWGRKYGMTLDSIEQWKQMTRVEANAAGRSGDVRLLDVFNGVTYTAQDAAHPDEREVMERIGGDLLFADLDAYVSVPAAAGRAT